MGYRNLTSTTKFQRSCRASIDYGESSFLLHQVTRVLGCIRECLRCSYMPLNSSCQRTSLHVFGGSKDKGQPTEETDHSTTRALWSQSLSQVDASSPTNSYISNSTTWSHGQIAPLCCTGSIAAPSVSRHMWKSGFQHIGPSASKSMEVHVPTTNPAYCAFRGLLPQDIIEHSPDHHGCKLNLLSCCLFSSLY